jgi:putative membrane protein
MAGMMGNGPGYGMMGGSYMASYGWIFQLLIILVLIFIVIWLLRGERFGYGVNRDEPPLEIAKRRYAAGEITKKEYEQLKRDLQ